MEQSKRNEINQYINNADDRFIQMVYAMIEADRNDIVAYSSDGKALNQVQYTQEINEARMEYANKQLTSYDALKKQVKGW